MKIWLVGKPHGKRALGRTRSSDNVMEEQRVNVWDCVRLSHYTFQLYAFVNICKQGVNIRVA
jgi:hypothetical protein